MISKEKIEAILIKQGFLIIDGFILRRLLLRSGLG